MLSIIDKIDMSMYTHTNLLFYERDLASLT